MGLDEVTGRQVEQHRQRFGVRRAELDAVPVQEGDHHDQGHALVAVDVRVVTDQAERVGGGQVGDRCITRVVPSLPRAG